MRQLPGLSSGLSTGISIKSWRLIMPIIIGLVLFVIAGLGINHFQQQGEQDQLREEMRLKTEVVESSEGKEDEFKAELAQIEREFEQALGTFPTGLKETDVYRQVLRLAQGAAVEVIVTPSDTRLETVEGVEYQVLSFTMGVEGGYHDVVSFVNTLDFQQTLLGSLVVNKMTIKMLEGQAEATLNFGVYSLPAP